MTSKPPTARFVEEYSEGLVRAWVEIRDQGGGMVVVSLDHLDTLRAQINDILNDHRGIE